MPTCELINSPSTVNCSLNCCWCCWALLRISLNLRSSSDSKLSPESGQTEARYWASAWCSPTRNWRPLPWEYSHSAFRLVIQRGRMKTLTRRHHSYHLPKEWSCFCVFLSCTLFLSILAKLQQKKNYHLHCVSLSIHLSTWTHTEWIFTNSDIWVFLNNLSNSSFINIWQE